MTKRLQRAVTYDTHICVFRKFLKTKQYVFTRPITVAKLLYGIINKILYNLLNSISKATPYNIWEIKQN